MMGIPQIRKPFVEKGTCHECGEKIKKNEAFVELEIFDNPFEKTPSIVRVHSGNEDEYGLTCEDKLTDESWAYFRYFTCAECGRMIIRQCPDNGWRSYVKYRDGEEICVACYQEDILENGLSEEAFLNGRIPGDFFGRDDILDNGWTPVQQYQGFFLKGAARVAEIRDAAITRLEAGKKVMIDYDRIGLDGSEGYVSLYEKGA